MAQRSRQPGLRRSQPGLKPEAWLVGCLGLRPGWLAGGRTNVQTENLPILQDCCPITDRQTDRLLTEAKLLGEGLHVSRCPVPLSHVQFPTSGRFCATKNSQKFPEIPRNSRPVRYIGSWQFPGPTFVDERLFPNFLTSMRDDLAMERAA